MPLPLLPLALGLASAGVGFYQRQQQQKALEEALKNRPHYKPAQAVLDNLGDAEAARYATDPSIIAAQQQAQMQSASQMGNVQRNATSGTQALGAASAIQSNYNAVLPSLAGVQSQFNAQNRAALMQARHMVAGEQQRVQEDALARSAEQTNLALGRQAAAGQLVSDGLGLAASAAYMGAMQSPQVPTTNPQLRVTQQMPGLASVNGTTPVQYPQTATPLMSPMASPPALATMQPQLPFAFEPNPYAGSPYAGQWWLGGAFGR